MTSFENIQKLIMKKELIELGNHTNIAMPCILILYYMCMYNIYTQIDIIYVLCVESGMGSIRD